MACGSFPICRCPAATTRPRPCPAAATPNAAVKSMYFRPSASHTFVPLARAHTIGHEPSGAIQSMWAGSYARRRSRTFFVLLFTPENSDALLVRRPDELVHLELKADRQRVGHDFFD